MGTNCNLAGNVNPASHDANVIIQEIYPDALHGRQPVALTYHDLEAWEGDCAIWWAGLSPWPGFQPRGCWSPTLRQRGSLWAMVCPVAIHGLHQLESSTEERHKADMIPTRAG